jgi:DNA-binding FadR family transcriptional regulator
MARSAKASERSPAATRIPRGNGRTVSAAIVDGVRAALFAGDLKPGDFLGSEADLAAHFGASRLPVREALRALRGMGVVEVRMGAEGGAFIAEPSVDSIAGAMAVQLALMNLSADELTDAQIAVECLAAELAAENADADDFTRLDALLAHMEAVVDDRPAFVADSIAFHAAMVRASHSRALIAQFGVLKELLASDYQTYRGGVLTRRVLARHRKLRDLIGAGDGDGARAQIAFALRDFRRTRVAIDSPADVETPA